MSDTACLLNNWFVDFLHEQNTLCHKRDRPLRIHPHLIAWQCYASCDGGNQFLEILGKKSELIKMLHDDDEMDYVERDDRLELRIYVKRDHDDGQNVHTFSNIDIVTLTDAVVFIYRGIGSKTCTCQPLRGLLHFEKTSDDQLPKNSLILGSWPFTHPPRDQVNLTNGQ